MVGDTRARAKLKRWTKKAECVRLLAAQVALCRVWERRRTRLSHAEKSDGLNNNPPTHPPTTRPYPNLCGHMPYSSSHPPLSNKWVAASSSLAIGRTPPALPIKTAPFPRTDHSYSCCCRQHINSLSALTQLTQCLPL